MSVFTVIGIPTVKSWSSIAPIYLPFTMCVGIQEEDVIGVLNSTDIAQLLPIGDRILVEVRYYPSVALRTAWYGCVNTLALSDIV